MLSRQQRQSLEKTLVVDFLERLGTAVVEPVAHAHHVAFSRRQSAVDVLEVFAQQRVVHAVIRQFFRRLDDVCKREIPVACRQRRFDGDGGLHAHLLEVQLSSRMAMYSRISNSVGGRVALRMVPVVSYNCTVSRTFREW